MITKKKWQIEYRSSVSVDKLKSWITDLFRCFSSAPTPPFFLIKYILVFMKVRGLTALEIVAPQISTGTD